jgi:hypothetical protein
LVEGKPVNEKIEDEEQNEFDIIAERKKKLQSKKQ